jgi:two-component system, NtrC family, nitrogen regulation response regulator GlnG
MRKPLSLRSFRSHRAPYPAPTPRFANILVLEDEASVREVLAEALGRQGYGVLAGSSLEEGHAILGAVGWRNIDLVLTDTHLSRDAGIRDGHAFHAEWRLRHPVPPFIFMDGWSANRRPAVPRDESCQIYGLVKPFSFTVLLGLIQGILDP